VGGCGEGAGEEERGGGFGRREEAQEGTEGEHCLLRPVGGGGGRLLFVLMGDKF